MRKCTKLVLVFTSILILTSCNINKKEEKKAETVEIENIIPSQFDEVLENEEDDYGNTRPISQVDLSSEKGIREYLIGGWVYDAYYGGDVICTMDIDKDLNVHLFFENSYSDNPKGHYSGKITFDRMYVESHEVPDLISIELIDADEPGGDFFFLHRTIYNEKRVMSWFFAGNGDSIFDILDFTGDFYNRAEEVIFEKTTGEKSEEKPRKNDEFYGVYWGMGSDKKSIWIDDVSWTPAEEDDSEPIYSRKMTHYETDIAESVLYSIGPEEVLEVLGEDLTKGEVYYVETDENGNIVEFISAEYKEFLEEGFVDNTSPETEDLIFDIIKDIVEIQEYLDSGMSILFTEETIVINGEECYEIALGTDHEENFVREIYYAINIFTSQVYVYDVINDTWEDIGGDRKLYPAP